MTALYPLASDKQTPRTLSVLVAQHSHLHGSTVTLHGQKSMDGRSISDLPSAKSLDILENPQRGPPTHGVPKPPSNKKVGKFQKSRKPRLSPKVNARSPKVNVHSPKVNVKYFEGIFEGFKVFEILVWGSRSQGFRKYLTKSTQESFSISVLPSSRTSQSLSRCDAHGGRGGWKGFQNKCSLKKLSTVGRS